MKKFIIEKTKFNDVLVITPRVFADNRGYFCETYNVPNLSIMGFETKFWQDNESKSRKNVIRGLHYQWQPAMGKLVRAVHGRILDVIVDIRKGSPTYSQTMSIELTSENRKQLWVPAGYAHGVLSLEDNTIISYKCSGVYNSEAESGLNPFDKNLNIDWGITPENAVVSEKDLLAKTFDEYDNDPKFYFEEEE